ncbi:MAG: hypothetical protein ACLGHX_02860 [Acidimicrobiia bacterium]
MNKLPSALVVLAVLVAACGSGEPGTMPTVYDPDDVVLTISEEGGFAPVETILGRQPRYVLQADGRLYMPGAIPMIYPGPMLMPVFVGTVDEAAMDRILTAIGDTGLGEIEGRVDDTTASDHVADATTTVITYFDGEAEHTLAVYALGIAVESSDLADAAAAVVDAVDQAAATVENPVEFRSSRVEIRTGETMSLPDPEFRNTRPWPLETAPDELPAGEYGSRCVVVEGPPATDLLEIFGEANQATVWEYEGTEYPLIARGLLPGEPGCR